MLLLEPDNALAYLRARDHVRADDDVTIESLPGGVSNQVLYVLIRNRPGAEFVLKQAREQLRVPDPWFSRLDRIWREVEVMQHCRQAIERFAQRGREATAQPQSGTLETPRVLFEDRENYAFAMSAAPRQHQVWKQRLLAGEADSSIARQCGKLLATIHAGTWHSADVAQALDDRQVFDELRIDPYYHRVASVHPDLRPAIERLIDSVEQQRHALVHADYSPKNLLVWPTGLMMVDFETGHYGDPAFDLGFFLSHLVLKSIYHAPRNAPFLDLTLAFWDEYRQTLAPAVGEGAYGELVARGIQNLAGCALARIDGKSRVDYLVDEGPKETVRRFGRGLLLEPPGEWGEVLQRLR
jgi:5-methylthioribose kinase